MNDAVARPVRFELMTSGGFMADGGGETPFTNLGALLAADPVEEMDAATRGYVDARGSGGPTTDWWSTFGTGAQGFGWIPPNQLGIDFGTLTTAARGVVRVSPVFIGTAEQTFDRLGVAVTAAVASSLLRLGVYSLSTTTLLPIALLVDAGTVDSSSTGVKTITLAPLTVAADTIMIGVGVMLEGAAGVPTLRGNPVLSEAPITGLSSSLASESASWTNAVAVADGALPAFGTVTTMVSVGSSGWLRRAT